MYGRTEKGIDIDNFCQSFRAPRFADSVSYFGAILGLFLANKNREREISKEIFALLSREYLNPSSTFQRKSRTHFIRIIVRKSLSLSLSFVYDVNYHY